MPENSDAGLLPHLSVFERIKHQEKDGREWWSARELMLLTYAKWQDFHKVIQAAIEGVPAQRRRGRPSYLYGNM